MNADRSLVILTLVVILSELFAESAPWGWGWWIALCGIPAVSGIGAIWSASQSPYRKRMLMVALVAAASATAALTKWVEAQPIAAPDGSCSPPSSDGLVECECEVELRIAGSPERPSEGRIRFPAEGKLFGKQVRLLVEASDTPWSPFGAAREGDQFGTLLQVQLPVRRVSPFSYSSFQLRRGFVGTGRAFGALWYHRTELPAGAREQYLSSLVQQHGPTSALAVSLAGSLGEKDLLDSETKRVFKYTGLSHLLVVSGYQVGMLFVGCFAALRWILSKSVRLTAFCPADIPSAGLALIVAFSYTLVIGGVLTTVRALAALSVIALARVLARRTQPLRALLAVFLLMILCWPGAVFEAGCQLTFAALLGLFVAGIWISEAAERWKEHPLRRVAAQAVAAALGPALFTTPVVLMWFHLFVPLGVLFNAVFVQCFSLLFSLVSGVVLAAEYLKLPGSRFLLRAHLAAGGGALNVLELLERVAHRSMLSAVELSPAASVGSGAVLGALAAYCLQSAYRRHLRNGSGCGKNRQASALEFIR